MYECFRLHLGHTLSLEPYLRPSIPGINLVFDTCNRAIAFEQPPADEDESLVGPDPLIVAARYVTNSFDHSGPCVSTRPYPALLGQKCDCGMDELRAAIALIDKETR